MIVRKKVSEASQQTAEPTASIQPEPTQSATLEAISQRAYEIYQARGGEHGDDLRDWLQAERELNQGASRSPLAAAASNAA
jgi:hypothetical protein